ncbi:MAG: 2'-5' RNA ligase family protein, partial [Saprospiraceae bacterium]|nr:2'-5' RNA ligase family protein [Saprospiraceae bacterium]
MSQLYFIALVPDEGLRGEIQHLKMEMAEHYDASHALKSPAHITLQMPFRWPEEEESQLFGSLDQLASDQSPFRVELDGFGCFTPRVIFVKVVDHAPVIQLFERVRKSLKKADLPEDKMNDDIHPHITIATRDLDKDDFFKAWKVYKKRPFSRSFTASRLSLLKYNGKNWEI